MKNPLKQNVEVRHSQSKTAWNIIGTIPGMKYKIARIPYVQISDKNDNEVFNTKSKNEALDIALFIAKCINECTEI